MAFDRSKFIDKFKIEVRERLLRLNLGLLKLEKSPKDTALLEEMMREAHSIKGAASMMGYKRIADISHKIEDGLEKTISQEVLLGKSHFDALFQCLDAIEPLLEDKVTWTDKGIERPFVDDLIVGMEAAFSNRKQEKAVKKTKSSEVQEHAAATVAVAEQPAIAIAQEESMRVDTHKLDKLVNLSGELLISKIRLEEVVKNLVHKTEAQKDLPESFNDLVKDLESVNKNIDLLTSGLQEEMMGVRMLPVAYLFNTFPRAMRDLAGARGKDVDFQIKGEETQLDKVILDKMKDPLMHLLRNCVDHGIEPLKQRSASGKQAVGKIILSAYHEGSQVVISVEDDGAGIDKKLVKEKAAQKGLVSKENMDTLTEDQVSQLLFVPGFSTNEEVSQVSGRGVGLDVVRQAVAKLKGQVEIKSVFGGGTTFIMRLPLTLAITESLIVAVGNEIFAIPIDCIIETIRLNLDEVKTVEAKEAITVRSGILPLIRLNDIFGLPRKGITERKFFPVIVAQSVEKKIAIMVDELIGRQEIISKAIGDPLKNIKNIAGATILGSGRVVLILDIPSIIESAEGVMVRPEASRLKVLSREKKKKTILLAEDVLSTAMLEKNILESVGYSVVIARDGKEALEKSAQETFDLIITDLLMPRMDGFELVAALKKDKLYKDIPVIIVTTRESDADKRRGLEVGADAYILKSEFTSEGLLEIIERLVG